MNRPAAPLDPGFKRALWIIIALVVAASLAFVIGLGGLILWLMRSGEPQQEALAYVRAHAQARQALGEPIELGWLIKGSIRIEGRQGEASLQIPLRGALGRAELRLEAELSDGVWRYAKLELLLEDSSQGVDLLPCPPSDAPCALPASLER